MTIARTSGVWVFLQLLVMDPDFGESPDEAQHHL